MSFYTSITGLNAAATELSVTSNNIANSGTASFKRSNAEFGDIFATSTLQRSASGLGSGGGSTGNGNGGRGPVLLDAAASGPAVASAEAPSCSAECSPQTTAQHKR